VFSEIFHFSYWRLFYIEAILILKREQDSISNERDSPKYFQTKPIMFWIPFGLKGKVWFGNTLGYPSHTTSGFLLAF
jgi:hypothetical protein